MPGTLIDRPVTTTTAQAADVAGKQLLAAVADIAPLLAADAGEAEQQGHLTARTVEAMRSRDLWRMRLCRDLGGLELPIVVQIEVLTALAAADPSSAWCTMVANNSVAVLGATMPGPAIDRIFAHGVPTCSIVAAPGGKATESREGYVLNGTWRLASGIDHAEWVHATALVDGDPSRLLPLALPVSDLEVLDTWHAVGLAATGSNDFTLTDYYLPAELAGRAANPFGQLRGTRRYDLVGLRHLESYEHLAFALGVGRRAVDELRGLLAQGFPGRHTADREVVQTELAQAEIDLNAIAAYAYAVYAKVDDAALGNLNSWSDADRHLPRALAVKATQSALRCTELAFHRAGGVAVRRPNVLEKLLRDMSVAATHVIVDDTALATYGQHLIESFDA